MSKIIDELAVNNPGGLSRADLMTACQPVLAEALVAQRLLALAKTGLSLTEKDGLPTPLQHLGGNFASTVAAMLPLNVGTHDAKTKRQRRQWQEQTLRQQERWPDFASVNTTAFLICADHKPSEYGLPGQLYANHKIESLAEWADFNLLLTTLLGAVSPSDAPTWTLSRRGGLREALVSIIAETFKNTHDHARYETNGAEVETSLRAIYARFYPSDTLPEPTARGISATPSDLYAQSFRLRSSKEASSQPAASTTTGLLEISILDSGPGMAAKWLGQNVEHISVDDQYAAVLKCFQKGQTSTSVTGRGYGLANVLQCISDLKGLISVRTNALHVYRQFAAYPNIAWNVQADESRLPKEMLFDWQSVWKPKPSQCTATKGTVVSFLIPMGDV